MSTFDLMGERKSVTGFGLIIIGSEILDGRVRDRHFEIARRLLTDRNHLLHYSLVISDDPNLIREQLSWAMSRPEPFFCCGGIGATPDDYTRRCIAEAAGVPLEFHQEAAAILKKRFGRLATLHRLKMIEFPRGARLIPNSFNQVPGFSIANGYFLPGFPEMVEPMIAWVLDSYYQPGPERIHRHLVLPGAREADLVDLMEDFIVVHPLLSFSSLPKFVSGSWEVHLGISGPPLKVEEGIRYLAGKLQKAGQRFTDDQG
ncbi:MAG: competence/damage-inducible protein A [Candidatus Euphemobacter frigidus]|nr:competence/damage-inducible protein A [Candidatus Euphemobacter frigidus]MDP8275201.1 competence/damage-inducible protein A [Candidatus Euphemobacter frigidus]